MTVSGDLVLELAIVALICGQFGVALGVIAGAVLGRKLMTAAATAGLLGAAAGPLIAYSRLALELPEAKLWVAIGAAMLGASLMAELVSPRRPRPAATSGPHSPAARSSPSAPAPEAPVPEAPPPLATLAASLGSQTREGNIFIAYRDGDADAAARRLYDRLVAAFGRARVYRNIDAAPPGAAEGPAVRIRASDALLVLIGPNWRAGENGDRLADEADFLRREIESAFAAGARVATILLEGASAPSTTELPAPLRRIAESEAMTLREGEAFSGDAARILDALS